MIRPSFNFHFSTDAVKVNSFIRKNRSIYRVIANSTDNKSPLELPWERNFDQYLGAPS